MFDDILLLIAARPFEPFTMHLASGAAISVPTVDHISVLPHVRRVLVDSDDGRTYYIIRSEQITHCKMDGQPA